MDDNTFWAIFYKCAALVLCVFTVTIGGCNAYRTKVTADAIAAKAGHPLDVSCALNNEDRQICAVRASR